MQKSHKIWSFQRLYGKISLFCFEEFPALKAFTAVFIGHRDYDPALNNRLESALLDLIRMGYCRFLSGGMGEFDLACEAAVRKLKSAYPHITLCLVSTSPTVKNSGEYDEIILPGHFNPEYRSLSIPIRNKLMLTLASAALCHVNRGSGGAYTTYKAALKEAITMYHI